MMCSHFVCPSGYVRLQTPPDALVVRQLGVLATGAAVVGIRARFEEIGWASEEHRAQYDRTSQRQEVWWARPHPHASRVTAPPHDLNLQRIWSPSEAVPPYLLRLGSMRLPPRGRHKRCRFAGCRSPD